MRCKRRVAELATTPLDPSRPLWHFLLIEGLDSEHSAMVSRIHHCIGDGIALMSVVLSIADGGKAPPVHVHRGAPDPHEDGGDWLTDAVIKPLTEFTVKAIGMYGKGVGKSMEMLAEPGAPLAGSLDVARAGYQILNDVAALRTDARRLADTPEGQGHAGQARGLGRAAAAGLQ